jgi:TetR/AcrR family transcriptional regulator, tetracycline repressor protein
MARVTTTSDALARAALEFIDENGVDALTLRALGQQVGMHHTAVYRHYRSKNELLQAVLAIVISDGLTEAGPLPEDPQERLIALITGLRAALHAHPAVTVAYLLPVESLADSEAASVVRHSAIQALRDLGLRGHDLLIRYQLLESFALGASVFDFGGAPEHIASRRRRHMMMTDPDFAILASSEEHVEAVTESAFELGLRTLVGECAAAGRAALVKAQALSG